MFDSDEPSQDKSKSKYSVGQDLYAASIDDMRVWIEDLRQDIVRIEAEIEKKQRERLQADAIFKSTS